jgi:hypothetical protein
VPSSLKRATSTRMQRRGQWGRGEGLAIGRGAQFNCNAIYNAGVWFGPLGLAITKAMRVQHMPRPDAGRDLEKPVRSADPLPSGIGASAAHSAAHSAPGLQCQLNANAIYPFIQCNG